MEDTKIEWATHTFNPWIGCTRVGPGCDHCYAETLATRFKMAEWGPGNPRKLTGKKNWALPLKWEAEAIKTGIRPRVFCASLADVFDNEVPEEWRYELFDLIERTPHLDWLILTKRIGNFTKLLPPRWMPLPKNVWLGATIVNQVEADRDIPKLLDIPATIRFLSMEPLLGPIDLTRICILKDTEQRVGIHMNCLAGRYCESGLVYKGDWDITLPPPPDTEARKIDWIIVGGESGSDARPMHPQWVRNIRDHCWAASIAFLFKQWGNWVSVSEVAGTGDHFKFSDGSTVRNTGKKIAGRTLDGFTHTEFPV